MLSSSCFLLFFYLYITTLDVTRYWPTLVAQQPALTFTVSRSPVLEASSSWRSTSELPTTTPSAETDADRSAEPAEVRGRLVQFHRPASSPCSISCMLSLPSCDGDTPCSAGSSGSAPALSSSRQVCRWPKRAARCSAVWPRWSAAFTWNSERELSGHLEEPGGFSTLSLTFFLLIVWSLNWFWLCYNVQ